MLIKHNPFSLTVILICLASCVMAELIEVASSPTHMWNGLAISKNGRMFATFHRMPDETENPSIAEVLSDGSIKPFPGGEWNNWIPGKPVDKAFVNTNAVQIFDDNFLWVVDFGAFDGKVIEGASKIVQIDLNTNKVHRIYSFGSEIAPLRSHLNDIRIKDRIAYISESGMGALIVLDLDTCKARRLLGNSPLTKADPNRIPIAEGKEMRDSSGKIVINHVDDIELSPDGQWLYFSTMTGPLRRIRTRYLRDQSLADSDLSGKVETYYDIPTIGGMTGDNEGNFYFSDATHSAISMLTPEKQMKFLVRDSRLAWPDAPYLANDGYLYIPVAQINRLPTSQGGVSRVQPPFKIFKLKVR